MKVILISGKAEAGKDSVCELLRLYLSNMNFRTVRLAFGDYVKDTARELWGWNGEKDERGRALLQWWGTDFVRARSSNFWVETVIRLLRIIEDQVDYVIIPDTRFPSEINEMQKRIDDVKTVRVERPGHISKLTEEQLKHPSETLLDDWLFDIVISATNMEELTYKVQNKLLPLLIERTVHI